MWGDRGRGGQDDRFLLVLVLVLVLRLLRVIGVGCGPDPDAAEIAVLRHEVALLRHQVARPRCTPSDRSVPATPAAAWPHS